MVDTAWREVARRVSNYTIIVVSTKSFFLCRKSRLLIVKQREKMEILGAGFCRTGTMSTRKALVDLGLTPCFHMESVVSNNLVSLFLQYFKGDKQPLVDYLKKEGYKARDRFIPE